MLTKIIDLERLDGFRLRIRFRDGNGGTHDFKTMVAEPGPMLAPFRARDYFSRVFLEMCALTWPNGFDISPEWLRHEMSNAGELACSATAG